MSKKYAISTIGILSTAMTTTGCEEKIENDTVEHESIANEWSATSMSYEGESISFPFRQCDEDDPTYCYSMEVGMVIDENQEATITQVYSVTQGDTVIEGEGETLSYSASVVHGDESNTYQIALENEDEFWGDLDCRLTGDTLNCVVEEDPSHSIVFSR